MPMAGRTVFQMDQTAPAHQIVFRHFRERSKNTDMDSRLRLCACGHHQETSQLRSHSLYDPTNFKFDSFRKNPSKSTAMLQS